VPAGLPMLTVSTSRQAASRRITDGSHSMRICGRHRTDRCMLAVTLSRQARNCPQLRPMKAGSSGATSSMARRTRPIMGASRRVSSRFRLSQASA
jgi:hypothetical protein